MFEKFNCRLKLTVIKCIFVAVRCILQEMHFVVIIMVTISYLLKPEQEGSQVV